MELRAGVPLLVLSAFWLGACPFSVWIGHWLLGKDIRKYGDGNPGAANVFRAGGRMAGVLAIVLDMAKGAPFVILAHSLFKTNPAHDIIVLAVGLGAILGHAFSPILHFRGGKAIGVTLGVFFTLTWLLPQEYLLVTATFLAFMLLGFFFIEIDAWIVISGITAAVAYVIVTTGRSWESLFMLCVLTVLATKHFEDLKTLPRFRGRLIRWLLPAKRQT